MELFGAGPAQAFSVVGLKESLRDLEFFEGGTVEEHGDEGAQGVGILRWPGSIRGGVGRRRPPGGGTIVHGTGIFGGLGATRGSVRVVWNRLPG